ncbi:putative l-type lectin-domain containing receptor kinase s.5 [Quercus suber]|uniref:non-specific serine/threonine protein kinase n=1 Tax=Quercus suber TaxID=58331 RepID=A0AAW0K9V8_QUESU
MCFSQVVWSLLLAVLLGGALTQVGCLDFNFSTFKKEDEHNLIITEGTTILLNAIQVTPDVANDPITNYSGRIFYSKPFRLWSKSKKITASFNTTFDLKITPDLSPKQSPVGEGMAFILAADTTLPQKSEGQWLGIVNASTNGSHQAKIVAVEFDTRKSYKEDIDDNHVGLDVNSIHSIEQVSLTKYGIKLNETYLYGAIKVRVQYDGKVMNVSAKTNKTSEYKLIFSLPLELSSYLPEKVFVGFSASTGNAIQTNCLKTWEFHSSHIDDEELEMLWALDYLHDGCEKRVLHRDIKASNIMLDSEFNAKLGDFGLARTLQQSENTHHTTKVIAGTLGYMAPETFLTGRATVETDVYAFGVLVLEVASGRKPGNQNGQSDYNNNIVHWLWDLHRQERILDAIDSRLT